MAPLGTHGESVTAAVTASGQDNPLVATTDDCKANDAMAEMVEIAPAMGIFETTILNTPATDLGIGFTDITASHAFGFEFDDEVELRWGAPLFVVRLGLRYCVWAARLDVL